LFKENMLIQKTKDGSTTLFLPEMNETYHSTHGAIQEAKHVFIENGIRLINKTEISVLEVGFGTGLNAILTSEFSKNERKKVNYVGLETIPLEMGLINQLNYLTEKSDLSEKDFISIHESNWEEQILINLNFTIEKKQVEVQNFICFKQFDVIYYDAFGPKAQIEMWDKSIFDKLHVMLNVGGILVTYCAMGQFKRDLKAIGFEVKSVPGPPGKREMTIALKK
jgi:tRNA U34 5-methylaminomethyl-2-thiouridine-forming methyltransferase MnmC